MDHPRSRGVYPWSACPIRGWRGSSPLARGLHDDARQEAVRMRIIPARAGFTSRPSRRRAGQAGSSPLARGLPSSPLACYGQVRIIPARAGFTDAGPGQARGPGDHPRSRGVYDDAPAIAPGLHGIIPARAGFTGGRAGRRLTGPDHPRSRGVYRGSGISTQPPPGSSPLARGLRPGGGSQDPHRGIIPARAGFTCPAPEPSGAPADHPRSRGVYRLPHLFRGPRRGSSPLARGLRSIRAAEAPAGGIIPARAGFTSATRTTCATRSDHPRSRGVYASPAAIGALCRGSSPLARGLPRAAKRTVRDIRIIPARAGFTGGYHVQGKGASDHPRSRGVYIRPVSQPRAPAGSSPLARGLLHHLQRLPEGGGIIPARAGFTPAA